MPVMDGHAATRAIRARRPPSLPIIALTANAFPEDARLCREAGMSDFLAKPLRKQTLVDAMLRALGPDPSKQPQSSNRRRRWTGSSAAQRSSARRVQLG